MPRFADGAETFPSTARVLSRDQPDPGRQVSATSEDAAIAKHYWKMADAATLRDVVLVVRSDEAHHRDINHGFASTLAGLPIDHVAAPYPPHAHDIRVTA